jgi:hypothetical protein
MIQISTGHTISRTLTIIAMKRMKSNREMMKTINYVQILTDTTEYY